MKGWLGRLRRRRSDASLSPHATAHALERAERRATFERELAGLGALLPRRGLGGWVSGRGRRPWWLVLGPAKVGKSSWLSASDLPLVRVESARSAGEPRRSVELWHSASAVVVELRGEVSDAEPAVFAEFVEILWRRCRRTPCAGIILLVSAEQIASAEAPALERHAEGWRERLHLLRARFRAQSPLHWVVTRLDALAGFEPFHAPLSQQGRSAPCGVSLPARLRDVEAECAARAQPLIEGVYAWLLPRLAAAGSPAERAALLAYPQRFAALVGRAGRLVALLARSTRHELRWPVAGMYFCSAGSAEMRSPSEASPSRHRRALAPAAASQWFVAELLRCVSFAERRNIRWTDAHRARMARARVVSLGAIALAALLLILPAAASLRQNASLLEAARAALGPGDTVVAAAGRGAEPSLDALLGALVLAEQAAERVSVRHWWGPHVAAELAPALERHYLAELRRAMDGVVREQLTAQLRSASDVVRLGPEAFEATYADLRLYLMLVHPARLDDAAARELSRVWSRARRRGVYPGGAEELPLHSERFVRALRERPEGAWPEDAGVVDRARAVLAQVPLAEIAYGRLARAAQASPVRLDDVFVGASARHLRVPQGLAIAGAYTAPGWRAARAALEASTPLAFDAWVVSDSEASAPVLDARQLRAAHLERHRSAWLDALASLEPVQPATLDDAFDMIDEWSAAEGPIVRLFRRLAEHCALTEPKLGALADALPEGGKEVPAAELEAISDPRKLAAALEVPLPELATLRRVAEFAFGSELSRLEAPAGSGLSQYREQLRTLLLAWRKSAPSDAAAMASELERVTAGVEASLSHLAERERLAVARLLMAPLTGLARLLRERDDEALIRRWREDVYPLAERLSRSYPFARHATRDASLDELTALLAPQTGKLWSFVDGELGEHVLASERGFEPRGGANGGRLARGLIGCLDAGKELAHALFPGQSPRPSFSFSVRVATAPGLSVRLEVEGQATPEGDAALGWQALAWPGEGAPGASLRVKSARAAEELKREGSFGLMRLLLEGKLRRTGDGRTWQASWQLRRHARQIAIELRPEGERHPFTLASFERFVCPAQPLEPRGGGAG